MRLNEHEFNEWKQHPGTLELMRWLDLRRDTLRREWEMGDFTTGDFQSTCLKNAENIGACDAYMEVQELDFKTMEGDMNGE